MERYNFTNPLFLLKIITMIRRFYILFCLVIFVSCDDGDILTVDLDFAGNLKRCDNFEEFHLIYDTRDDPSESLILILPKNTVNNALFTTPTPVGEPVSLDLSNSNNRFLYRSYNRNLNSDELCEIVPPASLTIDENYEANAGEVLITVTVVDDDNDGIPTEFEGLAGEPNEDGIYMDSLDSDGDGIPDYLDEDDDNDNVLTKDEIDNTDEDNNPNTNPKNTDADLTSGDTIPDYLDDDDDGDGIPTYLEDVDGDKNPRSGLVDKVVNAEGLEVYRYLYNDEDYMDTYPDPGKRITTFSRDVTTNFEVKDFDLEILRTTMINFGTLSTPLILTPNVF
ncbi:hypothetical protein [Winogradskyella bathintestinalis]|uniref:Uncharacterized protein n=1 Tax=Winogradskyella bathintestinalis TaxID=3035208 RepID=A0ABT7ZT08_9FLAO|nr:hypothetical protein [Winogradskyella bathintestinalis]MDN3492125.1 hypothetical protein [Winogradskyella bathintestinalis]